jgi:predicted nucleotidyltransferase
MSTVWPGTPEHQALLRAVTYYYAHDPRVRAVCVFGSLGRGNWNAFSDLDLDIVIGDEVIIEPGKELARLCASFASLGEKAALIIPDGPDAGDVVLHSRRLLSIRYHTLAETSANIVDSLRCLGGPLEASAIIAAGKAQAAERPAVEPLSQLLDRCVRHVIEVDAALQRGRLWLALDLLYRIRGLLMLIFGRSRNRPRPGAAFEPEASPTLQVRFAAAVPCFDLAAMRAALFALLDVLEYDLDELAAGLVTLSDGQRSLIQAVRGRAELE